MTTPPDLSFLVPAKYKTYVALIGTGLSFVVPFILEVTEGLSAPWPAVIGAVLWVLTALGVYAAPYKPNGAVLVSEDAVKKPPDSGWRYIYTGDSPVKLRNWDKPRNPWK